ncbi:MAG: alpha/beta hydrolase-fold protein [Actinomycetaceae bacterium]|nr:alpha/beta hydrolase-fold protein [Actinomycetaceae bacterium]MDU0970909.1 alpha/beta hydrolase-fold protein [Actinomycetaceae bacterium]
MDTHLLPRTPVTAIGAALRAPDGMADGEVVTIDGVAMVCQTFTWRRRQAGTHVMLYLEGFVDNHRGNIVPALMEPVDHCPPSRHMPGTEPPRETAENGADMRKRVLLPADGTIAYAFVEDATLPPDAGAQRSGWLRVRDLAQPDAAADERIISGATSLFSVWRGPEAPAPMRFPAPFDDLDDGGAGAAEDGWTLVHDTRDARDAEPTNARADAESGRDYWMWGRPDARWWVVLHDGQTWWRNRLGHALGALGREDVAVVAVDSGSMAQRAADLTDPERATALTARALAIAGDYAEHPIAPDQAICSGQSFGGLAALSPLVTGAGLADTCLAQSPSLWFGNPDGRGGPHMRLAASQDLRGRTISIEVGAHEHPMTTNALRFAEVAEANGATVRINQFRGAHSTACWRDRLLAFLANLPR